MKKLSTVLIFVMTLAIVICSGCKSGIEEVETYEVVPPKDMVSICFDSYEAFSRSISSGIYEDYSEEEYGQIFHRFLKTSSDGSLNLLKPNYQNTELEFWCLQSEVKDSIILFYREDSICRGFGIGELLMVRNW